MKRRDIPLADTTQLIDLVKAGLRNLDISDTTLPPRATAEEIRGLAVMECAQIRARPEQFGFTGPRIIDYDAIEVHALHYNGSDYDEINNIDEANTFAVYWHLVAGGVDCIGDAATYSDAIAFADALRATTGYPVHDMTT